MTVGSREWRDWDWARIGAYLVAARGTRTQREVADAIGVNVSSIQNLEYGRVPKGRKPYSLEPLAAYYGWKPGSIAKVGTGGDPDLYPVAAPEPLSALTRAERDVLVAEALADKTLTDSQIRVRVQALFDRPLVEDSPGSRDAASGSQQ